MNLFKPVSSIMTTDLKVVAKNDCISEVADIFNKHTFHHIPVVNGNTLVGLISKSDFLLFSHASKDKEDPSVIEEIRLHTHSASEIMTTGIAKLSSTDTIRLAIELFRENIFHSIPIVDDGVLVGIVTTFDIIDKLAVDNEAHISYND